MKKIIWESQKDLLVDRLLITRMKVKKEGIKMQITKIFGFLQTNSHEKRETFGCWQYHWYHFRDIFLDYILIFLQTINFVCKNVYIVNFNHLETEIIIILISSFCKFNLKILQWSVYFLIVRLLFIISFA